MDIVEALEKYGNSDTKMISRPDHDLLDVLNFAQGDNEKKVHMLRLPNGEIFEAKFEN